MLQFLADNPLAFRAVLILVVLGAIMTAVAYCIYFERKVSAWIQMRKGPNRVGFFGLFRNFHFWGLGQPIADGLKFLLKEDIIPGKVDRPLFLLAPALVFIIALVSFAVIPWGGNVDLDGDGQVDAAAQVANPGIGLLYILGVAAMGVYGVVLGGWASNNKFSVYGSMRAAAQMVSYEIPLGLAILTVVLLSGEVRLEQILLAQIGPGNCWNILVHPIAFLILLTTQFAETNRTPFDLAECEQELVGGYHTEYSALKFGMFFLAEYTHMIVGSALTIVLFFGGWHLPWVPGLQPGETSVGAMVAKMLCMGLKISAFIFFYMVVRWTVPRFRFDQLMALCWKGFVPITMATAAWSTLLVYWGMPAQGVLAKVLFGLIGNVLILALTAMLLFVSGAHVTGRQPNLPPLPSWAPAKPRPRVGVRLGGSTGSPS